MSRAQVFRKDIDEKRIHPTLRKLASLLSALDLRVFIIGARSFMIHGINIGRETKDWDIAIDKLFTLELRDRITETLRNMGFKVQWRKWGFLVKNDAHIDINYAPLTMDEEFVKRCITVENEIMIPSLEDLIILKLMSSEKKDIEDLKKALHQAWHRLDREYLYARARQAGFDEQLRRLLRRLRL
ncbi:MAG: DUF6036 family nucleotidyltransferase [Thermoprotei archaeon]